MLRTVIILGSLALGAVSAVAGETIAIPSFVEETLASGINSIYAGEWEYMAGGGVAAFDCNADGFPDMLLPGGTSKATFYRNVSKRGGDLRFEAQSSGLELERVTGAYPLDIDSDGYSDLAILRVGENVVMRGLGNCRFERANEKWGFDGGDAWSTAFAATWERGSDWPTLAVGNYIDRREEFSPWGSCTDNWLHRPGKKSQFAAPLALKPSFCALSILFTDWNRSGTPSLRVSNDREYYEGGMEQLWRIDPGEPPKLYTDKDGWRPLRIWGMGIASYDLNYDGFPEYFLTSMADNKLQTLASIPEQGLPKPSYDDVAYAKGVTAHRPYMGADLKPSTAWHAQFEDVNNDTFADLFVVKGNVAKMPDFATFDPNNLLLQGSDGKFVEAGGKAGVSSGAIGRGGALVDFNLDGLLDMVVVNRWENAQIWRNTSNNAGGWIQVKLEQPGTNREAVGAWLEVKCGGKVMHREITVGGGHAGGQAGWWHMGIGSDQQVEMRITWPDGSSGEWQRVEANNFYVVQPGKRPLKWAAK